MLFFVVPAGGGVSGTALELDDSVDFGAIAACSGPGGCEINI